MAERLARQLGPDFSVVPHALMAHALDTFGDKTKALSWLASPNPALDNAQPLELLGLPGGTERVEEVLTRIDYGIYS
jgi:putative toxin-antitoxin system antitoxin component (TIGR02293 family)